MGWLMLKAKTVSDSRLDASNYLVSTLTELLKIDGLAGNLLIRTSRNGQSFHPFTGSDRC